MRDLLILLTVVLLPIIPAWLLYRFLPSTGKVDGTWKGTQIKFGGAFAGYFVLFLTLIDFVKDLPNHEVWSIRGRIAFDDDRGAYDDRIVRFVVKPPRLNVYPDGTFDIAVFASESFGGDLELPMLIVEHPEYAPQAVDLEKNRERSILRRKIEIAEPIVLRRVPKIGEVAMHGVQ
jgi:hypothetical protein